MQDTTRSFEFRTKEIQLHAGGYQQTTESHPSGVHHVRACAWRSGVLLREVVRRHLSTVCSVNSSVDSEGVGTKRNR